MNTFIFISVAHLIEHIAQILEVYWLHLPREKALGLLGLVYPWLMQSETLHYYLALYMLIAIWWFRLKFRGESRKYWALALWCQIWHHLEHFLLLNQVLFGYYLFGRGVPTSVGQLFFPKIELHFFYNLIVFLFVMLAIWKKRGFSLNVL